MTCAVVATRMRRRSEGTQTLTKVSTRYLANTLATMANDAGFNRVKDTQQYMNDGNWKEI